MKKIFSLAISIAMILSITAIPSYAADATGYYDVAYYTDAEATTAVALEDLTEGQEFYARINLKNTTKLITSKLVMTWDNAEIQHMTSNMLTVATMDANYNAQCLSTLQKYKPNAWSQETAVYNVAEDFAYNLGESAQSNYSAGLYMENGTATTGFFIYAFGTTVADYAVSGDLLYANVKFVAGSATPTFAVAEAKVAESGMSAAQSVDVKFPEITDEDEVTYDPAYFAANFTWGPKAQASTGIEFKFNKKVGEENSTVYGKAALNAEDTAKFEANANVTLGVKVNDVPSNVTLTLTGADWYE